ncbi:MAG: helix-turn-helix domain-containing protein [Pikeienuella sp.]
MDQFIMETASIATIAITLFGAAFCVMQAKSSCVSRRFAVFLGMVAVNNVPDAFARGLAALPDTFTQTAELVLWTPSSLCLAPLFWVYVVCLTSRVENPPVRLFRHLGLPMVALALGIIGAAGPQAVRDVLFAGEALPASGPASLFATLFVLVTGLVHLALFPQMAIYLVLIVRRLMRHRLLLRDVYASTEAHELRWIYVIAGLGGLFWGARTGLLVLAVNLEQPAGPPVFLSVTAMAALGLIATTTLWGVRQRPPLLPDSDDERPPEPPKPPEPAPEPGPQALDEPLGKKYEKSALSAEAGARIAAKLRRAMEVDHLHRDPNLSLWILARHIGASPNYISQTLNEVIGESFFDFVNGYRIAEAKSLLSAGNQSVLTITHEVGFNSRSSFYTAFKRVTGETPSGFRKKMSVPVGADDAVV